MHASSLAKRVETFTRDGNEKVLHGAVAVEGWAWRCCGARTSVNQLNRIEAL